jgi:hypothetical protein
VLNPFFSEKTIRTLIILVQDKNTSLKLPVRKSPSKLKSIPVGVSPLQPVNLHRNGDSPLQLVNLHRNRRYFVIKLQFLSWTRIMSVLIVFSEKKGMRVPNVSPYKNNNYQTNFIIDDPLSRKHRSLTFVDNALHVLYTRVFIRKFPFIFEKPQNYVRPSAMHKFEF